MSGTIVKKYKHRIHVLTAQPSHKHITHVRHEHETGAHNNMRLYVIYFGFGFVVEIRVCYI